jgi:hypothetical protein
MLQFATHEIGRFPWGLAARGESGGLLESLKTSSHKINHFKAYKHAESILKWKIVDVTVCLMR